MPSLIVRNVDAELTRRLKQQAARHSRSAEAEHRAILETALVKTRRKTLAEVLAGMPNVGRDADFVRHQRQVAGDVFG